MNNPVLADTSEKILPQLRSDIHLLSGEVQQDGSKSWLIYDPIRAQYFKIGWQTFMVLSRWSANTIEKLLSSLHAETSSSLNDNDIEKIITFLDRNELLQKQSISKFRLFARKKTLLAAKQRKMKPASILFIKIPLLNRDDALHILYNKCSFLFNTSFVYFSLCIGLFSLYLVSQQWDIFVTSFQYFFNFWGVAGLILALAMTQLIHEFGHALTSIHFGSRVKAMGVGILLFFPILYTDSTDSWKIPRNKRLIIGLSGVLSEILLACYATLFWCFLTDGILRSIMFQFATVAWLGSILINCNPFLKFDGYYLLSDLLKIPNLMPRAKKMGIWYLREMVLGLRLPPPEIVSVRKQKIMIIYSWSGYVYRLLLFTLIALILYQIPLKVVAIFLCTNLFFISVAMPLFKEIWSWREFASKIMRSPRSYFSLVFLVAIITILFFPWHDKVPFQSILDTDKHTVIYTKLPGQVETIMFEEGMAVKQGDVLLTIASPDISAEEKTLKEQIRSMNKQLERIQSSGVGLDDLEIIFQQIAEYKSRLQAVQNELDKTRIRASMSGIIRDINPALHKSRWINSSLPLAIIVNNQKAQVVGFIREDNIARIKQGDHGKFYPDTNSGKSFPIEIANINVVDQKDSQILFMSHENGGDIALMKTEEKNNPLKTEHAYYKVIAAPLNATSEITQVTRGKLVIDGKKQSYAKQLYDNIYAVFLRESGF